MDENLVGYLLDALEPDERRAVEAHLRASPEARAKLEVLRRALAPLAADAGHSDPPPGLALRTLARVAEYRCRPLPPAPKPPPSQRGSGPPRWFRRADVLVAASILVVVGGLFAPWLVRERALSQRVACQNNLRALWAALEAYSEEAGGRAHAFPRVEASGPRSAAGAFVPQLRDAGVLDPAVVSVGCPAQGRRPAADVSVRDLEEAFARGPEEYGRLVRDLAGDYAYPLGYREGGVLVGLTRDSGDLMPLLADRSGPDAAGNSPNHGGAGQNVLYVGGPVRWATGPNAGVGGDNIYVNRQYRLGPGVRREDSVLAASHVRAGDE
jgi:hypothetical protein